MQVIIICQEWQRHISREAETLDAPLDLTEGDTVTIIRLVMLTGGYF